MMQGSMSGAHKGDAGQLRRQRVPWPRLGSAARSWIEPFETSAEPAQLHIGPRFHP